MTWADPKQKGEIPRFFWKLMLWQLKQFMIHSMGPQIKTS